MNKNKIFILELFFKSVPLYFIREKDYEIVVKSISYNLELERKKVCLPKISKEPPIFPIPPEEILRIEEYNEQLENQKLKFEFKREEEVPPEFPYGWRRVSKSFLKEFDEEFNGR